MSYANPGHNDSSSRLGAVPPSSPPRRAAGGVQLPRSSTNNAQTQSSSSDSSGQHHMHAGDDPFLARTENIQITEEDRQEGYDVDLLRAKPRTAKQAGPGAAGAVPASKSSRYGSQAYASESKAPIIGLGTLATDGSRQSGEGYSSSGGGGTEKYAGAHELDTPRRSRHPRWFTRPLVLLLLLLIVLAVALGVGLGVGLGTKHQSKALPVKATTGTVDSSTYYTTTALRRTTRTSDPLSSSSPTDIPTGAATSGLSFITNSQGQTISFVTTDLSSAAPLASTGNIPIPINSETTRDGTVFRSMTTDVGSRNKRSWTYLPAEATPPPVVERR